MDIWWRCLQQQQNRTKKIEKRLSEDEHAHTTRRERERKRKKRKCIHMNRGSYECVTKRKPKKPGWDKEGKLRKREKTRKWRKLQLQASSIAVGYNHLSLEEKQSVRCCACKNASKDSDFEKDVNHSLQCSEVQQRYHIRVQSYTRSRAPMHTSISPWKEKKIPLRFTRNKHGKLESSQEK